MIAFEIEKILKFDFEILAVNVWNLNIFSTRLNTILISKTNIEIVFKYFDRNLKLIINVFDFLLNVENVFNTFLNVKNIFENVKVENIFVNAKVEKIFKNTKIENIFKNTKIKNVFKNIIIIAFKIIETIVENFFNCWFNCFLNITNFDLFNKRFFVEIDIKILLKNNLINWNCVVLTSLNLNNENFANWIC